MKKTRPHTGMPAHHSFDGTSDSSRGAKMSRTRKDSKQGTTIEIIKREDGTFDLFLNRRLEHGRIHADGMVDVLCVRFGYCADEFDAILYELNQNGRAERKF